MVSERQIKANRRNARKSTGPKTRAGRERTRSNAYRHGLAAVFNREALAEIEELARQLVGDPRTLLLRVPLSEHRGFANTRRVLRLLIIQRPWFARVNRF